MIELHAVEWFTIIGRGDVAVIYTPYDDLSSLKNQVVQIDGKSYLVRGVEYFHPRKPSDPFGLLVREILENEPVRELAPPRKRQGVLRGTGVQVVRSPHNGHMHPVMHLALKAGTGLTPGGSAPLCSAHRPR